jgi:hypothetical protein
VLLGAGTAPAAASPRVATTPLPLVLAAGSAPDGAAPRGVQIPTAGIDTALTPVGLTDGGTLVPPDDPVAAGWLRTGPAPGEPGPAVLAGHVDGTAGPAAFFRLSTVEVGDRVLVARADGSTVRFTITRVARYAKDAFPTREVYGPTPDPQLRLITCGGAFDRAAGHYRDNVVVYARLT